MTLTDQPLQQELALAFLDGDDVAGAALADHFTEMGEDGTTLVAILRNDRAIPQMVAAWKHAIRPDGKYFRNS